MTGEDTRPEDDVLHVLELLAGEAPAREYERLLARARGSTAAPHRLDRVERATRLALDVGGHFDRHRRREAELVALVDTARELTQAGRPDATLRLISRRARLLLHVDFACTVLLAEPGEPGETDVATLRAADGAVSALTVGHRIPAAALPADTHGERPGPFWTADLLSGDLDPHTAAHAAALGEIVHAESLHAVLGVPLRADDRHLGHLYVADRKVRHFTPDEVTLMCSLADLSAVALSTARLLESARAANAELERAGSRARSGLSDALRGRHVQDDLVRLVLDGIGLDQLIARAATELGGGLSVRGQAGERLAEHGRIPRPDGAELERVRLNAAATGIACPLTDGTWVVPLTVRRQDIGCLLFHPDGSRPHPPAGPGEQVLLSYARTVSLLLTQQSTAADGGLADAFLEDLVTWEGPTDRLVVWAGRLCAELDRPHVVVVARAQTDAAALVERWATAYVRRHRGMKTVQGGRLVLLLPGDDPASRAEDVRAELAAATGAPVTAGAAGHTQGAGTVPRVYQEAVRCFEALTALGGSGRAAAARDLGFIGMLLADDQDVPGFVERTLGPLLDHDAERFSTLVETLEGWFSAAGSPTRAAEILYVHPNTVSRRMERITQLLGRDWQRPEQALELQLALRLLRARASLAPAGLPSPGPR
ncbi:helix-turn-helix domain-containing protein [Streptomyces sp. GESEQ-35]|uniref:helix-turn-helix domain-containing protein n=1 Tax=Streptomyces sp. GESEQ-35 TaxID=2812657 RepID=UPI001B327525|nr:helix-turn-helix domain-containing protein [Streptomyces sp. GESEQ-35]